MKQNLHISPRAKLSYYRHLFNAIFKNYHQDIAIPFGRLLKPDSVIFDIGANTGRMTKMFCKHFPDGFVYAFEPSPYAYPILSRVVERCRLKNVEAYNFGLGDSEESLEMVLPTKANGVVRHGLAHLAGNEASQHAITQTASVFIKRLDDFVAEHEILRIDLIKADIEGYEFLMLEGAKKTITTHRPFIFLELDDKHLSRQGHNVKDVWAFLKSLDYKGYSLSFDKTSPLTELADNTASALGKKEMGDIVFAPN